MASQPLSHPSAAPPEQFDVRLISHGAPFGWLKAGVHTLRAAPIHSLLYGALFALACVGVVMLTREFPWFTAAFLTGLLLVAQFLAAGLYAAARRHERDERMSIRSALSLLRSRATNLALYALFLSLVMAAWVRLSALLFAIKFTLLSPSIDDFIGILTGQGDPIVIAFFVLIGFALAATVFVTSAVAVPLIVDRDAGPITAIVVSARTFSRNWAAMLVWAILITTLSLIGIMTGFAAMVVIYPILGYATWQSYRALVA